MACVTEVAHLSVVLLRPTAVTTAEVCGGVGHAKMAGLHENVLSSFFCRPEISEIEHFSNNKVFYAEKYLRALENNVLCIVRSRDLCENLIQYFLNCKTLICL